MNPAMINGISSFDTLTPEMINGFFKAMEVGPKVLAAIAAICVLVFLVKRSFIGFLCNRFAQKKGYKGYFFTGFFLGWLGFVYVLFLPDLKMQKYLRMAAMRIQVMEDQLEQLEEQQKEAV